MDAHVILTPAESKRLIARGVAALPLVRQKMEEGMILLCQGSTNGYVYEELLGQPVDKRAFLAGRTLPMKNPPTFPARLPDLALRDGQPWTEGDKLAALEKMQTGDIVIKGANALNYEQGVAGVLIGNPIGGTLAALLGHVFGRRLNLIIPIGLEKCIGFDIEKVAERLRNATPQAGPTLWPVRGTIVTEIEALRLLTGVEACQTGAGGIAGAEGAVRLFLQGTEPQVGQAKELISSIQGEPAL
jgi:hypothetical protein